MPLSRRVPSIKLQSPDEICARARQRHPQSSPRPQLTQPPVDPTTAAPPLDPRKYSITPIHSAPAFAAQAVAVSFPRARGPGSSVTSDCWRCRAICPSCFRRLHEPQPRPPHPSSPYPDRTPCLPMMARAQRASPSDILCRHCTCPSRQMNPILSLMMTSRKVHTPHFLLIGP